MMLLRRARRCHEASLPRPSVQSRWDNVAAHRARFCDTFAIRGACVGERRGGASTGFARRSAPCRHRGATRHHPLAYHRRQLQCGGGVFSRDGRRFIAWGGRTIEIFDIVTGQPLHRIPLGGGLNSATSAALSPDGKRLATFSGMVIEGDWAYYVRNWDLSNGRELAKGAGPVPYPQGSSLGFTHDGRLLVAYAASSLQREAQDAVLRKPIPLELFDGGSGRRLATFKGTGWLGQL